MADFREVNPSELHIPSSRAGGADLLKLQRQIAKYGDSVTGLPPLEVYEGSDGALLVYNGVTRATRVAKLSPGTLVRVEVIGKLRRPVAGLPKIGDHLP